MELVRSVTDGETERIILHRSLAERLEYKIKIIEDSGIPGLIRAGKLFVNIQDDGNTLEFKKKKGSDPSLLVIQLREIIRANPVTVDTSSNLAVRIKFARRDSPTSATSDGKLETNSIKFDIGRKEIPLLLEQIDHFKDEKINPSIARAIAVAEHPNLCIQCAKRKYVLKYRHDYNLCRECFVTNYGRPILETIGGEYYGGHKAYLGGGTFGKFEKGILILSEHYLTFVRVHDDPAQRWEIVIPLDSVIVEGWGIEESSRRKSIAGGAFLGIGGGVIHDKGKSHHIVVPYTDENGIPQEPRFGVSSFQGKEIREWAIKLYQQVVNEKRESVKFSSRADNNTKQTLNQEPISSPDIDDPLKILKIRFAKGEITKEQYEEMRKMLES
jgi:hypothetical protein